MSTITAFNEIFHSLGGKEFIKRFKAHYKAGNIWTIETGCLLFSSWMVYYLMFLSSDATGALDIIVTIFFFLGALIFLGTSSLFKKISKTFASKDWLKYLNIGNKYIFMVLSFLPGLYYAFKYEHFILKFYIIVYFISSGFFVYKRYKEFELEPFVIGLGMSVVLYYTEPFIEGFFGLFGSGWFMTGCASFVKSTVDLALAVAFLLDLPRKYLPANMLFGLKFVKFLMYFLSWQTWFILMVFATWRNVGAGAQAFYDVNNTTDRKNVGASSATFYNVNNPTGRVKLPPQSNHKNVKNEN